MSQISTITWRKFGHHRVYFSSDSVSLGWLDMLTDAQVPVCETDAEQLRLAIAVWRHYGEPAEFSLGTSRSGGLGGQTDSSNGLTIDFLPPALVSVSEGPGCVSPPPLPSDQPAGTVTSPSAGAPPDDDAGWAMSLGAFSAGQSSSDRPVPTASGAPDLTWCGPLGWSDLSVNRAGAQAQQQAHRAREEQPIRSFLGRLMGAHTEERAWRIGAKGERLVAAQLQKLMRVDPRWRVVHSVPVGDRGSDIDHIVIGPAGVFTINAKHHPGGKAWVGGDTVMVNGHRHPYVRNSRFEAARAARLLSAASGVAVEVTGVVAFVGLEELRVKQTPGDVVIVSRRRLRDYLQQGPAALNPDLVAHLYEFARRSSTWTTGHR